MVGALAAARELNLSVPATHPSSAVTTYRAPGTIDPALTAIGQSRPLPHGRAIRAARRRSSVDSFVENVTIGPQNLALCAAEPGWTFFSG